MVQTLCPFCRVWFNPHLLFLHYDGKCLDTDPEEALAEMNEWPRDGATRDEDEPRGGHATE